MKKLEEEIKVEKPDKSKVRSLLDWMKINAQWVVPALKEVIEGILKTLGS